MKALTTAGLTKLIQLIKSSFIKTTDTVTTNTVTLATVATSGSYNDLINQPTTIESVEDQRDSSSLKYWTGTKAQYDAIVTKDSDTIYNVEDTTSPIVDILNTLYPIGAIYIGTMATCPLSVLGVGTWQLVAQDRVLQGAGTNTVGDTVEAGLPLANVSIPTTGSGENNNLWHRSNLINNGGSLARGGYSNDAWQVQTLETNTSTIYGNSTTVQPPAYLVNIWERTA